MLGALFFSAETPAQTPAPHNDEQEWNEVQVVVPLQDKVDLLLIGVLRLGRESLLPVDERGGAAVAFKPSKHLTIQPTYLYVAQQPTAMHKNFEHRLIFNATGRFSLGNFNFTDRNLIERRVRHARQDFTMYRNRLQIDHPARISSFRFRAYVADEVFYDSLQQAWMRNRFAIGAFKQFTPHFYGEIFYLHQNDGRARPGNVHAVGTLLRFTL